MTEFRTINAQQHKKLGETDIRFHKRIEELEESQPEIVTEIPKTMDTSAFGCLVHNCEECNKHIATDPNE